MLRFFVSRETEYMLVFLFWNYVAIPIGRFLGFVATGLGWGVGLGIAFYLFRGSA
jgi:hypothetical protein